MMPLGGHHLLLWTNYLGELNRAMPLYYPSWQKVLAERKAGDRDQNWGSMASSETREYPLLIDTFFVTHTVNGEEMMRLRALGSNTESGVPYTNKEINAMARKASSRGTFPVLSLGRVARERIPGELSPSNYLGRHVARDEYPQRLVAVEGVKMSLGIMVNVVVLVTASKEDDVSKISTSIFVTNFPESCSAKELFHACKQYGHVVDSFIPLKRSKSGKRFGFVRFINVFNVERLVNNLCTVWVDRVRLHANVARFNRATKQDNKTHINSERGTQSKHGFVSSTGNSVKVNGNSYVQAVKGECKGGDMECDLSPAIVLDEECLSPKELDNSLMGRVKDFSSLGNLKNALLKEGFVDFQVRYLGELWVLIEFESSKTKDHFKENVGVGSWFSALQQASPDLNIEGRIAWIDIEGVPLKLWSNSTFNRIALKWGKLVDVDDDDESCYYSKRLCVFTKSGTNIYDSFKIVFRGKVFWIRAKEVSGWVPEFTDDSDDEEISVDEFNGAEQVGHDARSQNDESEVEEVPETVFDLSAGSKDKVSEDPFDIYTLLNKQNKNIGQEKVVDDVSLTHPPGFTPKEAEMSGQNNFNDKNQDGDTNLNEVEEEFSYGPEDNRHSQGSRDNASNSVRPNRFKKPGNSRMGGSILNLLEELVKVGQTMGYNMEGCVKDMTDIIESQGEVPVNLLALQETKMEYMDLFTVKRCWENFAFDFVHSDAVGNSGGILCAWDTNSFQKSSSTVSDYFVIIRGVWIKTGVQLLIVVVYAPHDFKDKCLLWDYLSFVCNQWDGEVVMMGDFNEVRDKSERFGSIFNQRGADRFNSFISSAGLVEVISGGCTFTWCHRSASKMSKLDRFLISENFMNLCPNISALTLDRFLSDHRPVLLRESKFDFGPIPFRFYHYWMEVEGFNEFVKDMWRVAPVDQLKEMDAEIDKGTATDDTLRKRVETINSIIKANKLKASEVAQKAKIRWAVEGDENSRFYHGTLNKTRHQQCIRGILVDGVWTESPNLVKNEFVQHFGDRFSKPQERRASIDMSFPNVLTFEQKDDLERDVTSEEVKRAVWDCGTDKSPGKIMANRLVGVLGDIVSEEQSAFIANRQILDGPFILNEVMHWCKAKKKQALIFKVDFEKAYDSVRWDFLDEGDPLSPFLFILIMESLHLSFQRVVEAGMFSGISLSSTLTLSHMFYADDAIFIGNWKEGNIDVLVNVLECFHQVSGLRINMCKSKILGIHVADVLVKQAAAKLGCLVLNTPFVYLGTKVGAKMSRVNEWNEVVEKVKNRLSKWKVKALSIGGRLTLLKSVLGSIPIFYMSIYRAPSRVLKILESIRNQFFNGNDLCSKKAAWIKWSSVPADKSKGGLGIASLYALNRGLMIKWVWRFLSQSSALWVRVVKAIHGEEGKLNSNNIYSMGSCWLNIVKEVRMLATKGVNAMEFVRHKLGNGEMTRFWEDTWMNDVALKDSFPRLYALERFKNASVSSKLNDLSLEVALVPMSDRYVWSLNGSGDFSVASIRKVIDDSYLPSISSRTRWIKNVPIKVNILTWKIKMDALPTRFNLSRRGIDIESISCPICDCGVETSSHLFFRCSLSRQIVSKILLWWDVPYVEVESYAEWLEWLGSVRMSASLKLMFEGVFSVFWWLLWSFRNKTVFETSSLSKSILFDDVVSSSFHWSRSRSNFKFSRDE
ncbi:RNA-directed DNA polymerase, eukaryota, reverse transcriptase zinc-binding domain protein [Tanacetum coccineum]